VEVARVLVEAGADITKASNDGSTPLQIAKGNNHNHPEIVSLLEAALRKK
jgi:ankyrin repeat protein